ncbi:MAG: dual specificity protein phosphatase [Anaerolineae bacterium]
MAVTLDLSAIPEVDHVADGVCISGYRATQYANELWQAGIRHVLKLYDDIPFFPRHFTVLNNYIEDGEPLTKDKLQRGVAFITEQVNAERPVLVMCAYGISRSSTFVLAYLLTRGHTLRQAYDLLKQRHPQANPHPLLWKSLIEHYQLTDRLEDVAKWGR